MKVPSTVCTVHQLELSTLPDMWVYKWYIIINYEILSGIGGLGPDLFWTRAMVLNLCGVWTPRRG